MGTTGLLLVAVASIALLLVAVIRLKVPAFLALLGVSVLTAIVAGIPLGDVVDTIVAGMGGTLGNVALLVGLGTMLGKLIEISGGARSLAEKAADVFGQKRLVAALVAVAFMLAIPVFFDVGFIVLVPIIYGFAVVLGVDPVKVGLPVAGIMLAIHVTVPPHPGVVGGAALVDADLGWLTILGLVICLPLGVLSYYVARMLNRRDVPMLRETARSFATFTANTKVGARTGGGSVGSGSSNSSDSSDSSDDEDPIATAGRDNPAGWGSIVALILLPIVMIMFGTVGGLLVDEDSTAAAVVGFVGAPAVALLVTTALAYWLIGVRRGLSSQQIGQAL
ncbi:MAG: hypothetical protein WA931_07395, partial [Rhodococcus sp. (in: high G+C Gram-positive bacteria)]